jgi:hypothetical protein
MHYNAAHDGHKAWNTLEKQVEGPAAITTRKAKAYTSIDKAVYSGYSAYYTFDM